MARVSGGATQSEIAAASGVYPSNVSRWKHSKSVPSLEALIRFARHYGRSPVEGMVAAGFITSDEASATISVATGGIADLPNAELIAEIARRLGEQPIRFTSSDTEEQTASKMRAASRRVPGWTVHDGGPPPPGGQRAEPGRSWNPDDPLHQGWAARTAGGEHDPSIDAGEHNQDPEQ